MNDDVVEKVAEGTEFKDVEEVEVGAPCAIICVSVLH